MEHLRKYNDSDKEFVYQTKKDAYKKYVIECFGSWNEEDQRKYFDDYINKTSNDTWIICDKNKSIGFYAVLSMDNGDYIIGNICIIPDYQGKGIGTKILNSILDEHKDNNIYIQYFKQNPVGELYKRLGFIPAGETQFHYQMVKLKKKEHIK